MTKRDKVRSGIFWNVTVHRRRHIGQVRLRYLVREVVASKVLLSLFRERFRYWVACERLDIGNKVDSNLFNMAGPTATSGVAAKLLKIVVFGATGRTGKEVVKQALEKGHHVTAVVRTPEKVDIQWVNYLAADCHLMSLKCHIRLRWYPHPFQGSLWRRKCQVFTSNSCR